jgi:divalent metal cation (Fe/Co/Zn/Cd) transporter
MAAEAIESLIEGAAAETSWLDVALTAGTLMLCPWLGRAKQRIGEKLGSRATYGEGSRGGMLPRSVARWFGAGKSLARL